MKLYLFGGMRKINHNPELNQSMYLSRDILLIDDKGRSMAIAVVAVVFSIYQSWYRVTILILEFFRSAYLYNITPHS